MTTETRLKPKQQRLLDWVACYLHERGHSPTLREIQEGLGWSNPSTPHRYLQALRDAGYVTWNPGKIRSIKLTPAGLGQE